MTASPFVHGVASGDPTHSSVAIWTALSHDMSTPVEWTLALDAEFTSIVATGTVEQASSRGDVHVGCPVTVRVDGLAPDTLHHYRFRVGGHTSPTGRCATLASPDTEVARFRLGLASCARLASAPFAPYAELARAEPDLVVHLGDYIYEDGAAPHDPPTVCIERSDYHRRHSQYRRSKSLQELHRVAPWVALWDDHDVANNSWRTGAAGSTMSPQRWERRRQDAQDVYLDWMPQAPSDSGPSPMDRRLRLGTLGDIVVLDARNAGRERPVKEAGPALVALDDERRIISDEQWSWLRECVEECPGWLVVCTQTQVSPLRLARLPNPRRRMRVDPLVNPGQWDGYPVERRRLAALLAPVAGRVLLCSGDLHGRFHTALELESGSSVPEVTSPSIASRPFADAVRSALPVPTGLLTRWLHFLNPHVSFMGLDGRGSTVLDIAGSAIEVIALGASGSEVGRWRIERGDPSIVPVTP